MRLKGAANRNRNEAILSMTARKIYGFCLFLNENCLFTTAYNYCVVLVGGY
jgi:hypothetical protein